MIRMSKPSASMRLAPRYHLIGILCLILLLFPSAAMAYDLACYTREDVSAGTIGINQAGTVKSGNVFIGIEANCDAYGLSNIFSGLNCQFKSTINEIMNRMYCGLQHTLQPLLMVMILLFVVLYGIQFTFGMAKLTASELTTRLIKIALIWTFAMYASWGVGIAFYFLSGSIEMAVSWAMQAFTGSFNHQACGAISTASNVPSMFIYIDCRIYELFHGRFSVDGQYLFAFIAALAINAQLIFFLMLYLFFMIISTVTRALVTYLLGLSAIAFLLSLGPIFVSMALFKPTFTFFESWLRYIISFAMQIVLVFACVALWLFVMDHYWGFFKHLANIMGEYQLGHNAGAVTQPFYNDVGVCLSDESFQQGQLRRFNTEELCGAKDWAPPSRFATHEGFVSWLTLWFLTLSLLVYAFHTLLKNIPDIARVLSGPRWAPQLAGGAQQGAVNLPGFTGMGNIKEAGMTAFGQGTKGVVGNLQSGLKAASGQLKKEVGIAPPKPSAKTVRSASTSMVNPRGPTK